MSEGFVLNFYNNTDVDATLTATVGSWGEWESKTQHNPEVDIQALPARRHRLTPAETAAPIHLETSSGAAAATFTVSADLGGKQLVFELDGCDATKMRERAGIPVSVGGQDFTVLQVMTVMDEIDNGDSRWNKMSVFITPRVDTKKWMSQYPDRTLMSVNIPGTHDTGT
jgi:hypothetical protein